MTARKRSSNKHLADVEEWRPTAEQQLKVALDVAKGMEYLHTCFQHDGSQQDQVSTTTLHLSCFGGQ